MKRPAVTQPCLTLLSSLIVRSQQVNATARQFGLELVTSETEEGGTGYELTTHGSAPLASYSNSLAATVSTANGMGGGGADVQGVPYKARVVVGVSLGGAAGDGHLARGSLDRVRGVTAEDMHLAVTPRARSAAGEREQQAGHVSATLEAARSSSNDLQVGVGRLWGMRKDGGHGAQGGHGLMWAATTGWCVWERCMVSRGAGTWGRGNRGCGLPRGAQGLRGYVGSTGLQVRVGPVYVMHGEREGRGSR